MEFCPTGMLEPAFPVHDPLDTSTNPWLAEIDRLLLEQASTVHAA